MKLSFATLDVFTDRRFTGNPLAVVFDADVLDDARMQIISREFGHPETVFVLKPAAGGTARVRIFTPSEELPFAGHPTVGTAVILGLKERGDAGNIVLEEKIGLVHCTASFEGANRGHARFLLPELPKPAGDAASNEVIAAALGLSAEDIGFENLVPARWSAGNTFTFVPVRDLDAARRCRPNEAGWNEAFEAGGGSRAYVFCRETVDAANTFHARMFAFRLGFTEDPATGSAAAAFARLATQALSLGDGEHRLTIEQGYEMGRPSVMELLLQIRDGKLASASIGGPAVLVTEGTIEA
ncbi:MAG: PhzF family phenazine biosynthesis isomerase [Rhizobiales bacterium]|nr:PhzF family phenazine biosynthesis isomerase [Hyphomicrobiales bacterium]